MTAGTPLRAAAVLAMAVLLAGCQSATPPAVAGETVTVGDTTITTGGRVRVEGTYVD